MGGYYEHAHFVGQKRQRKEKQFAQGTKEMKEEFGVQRSMHLHTAFY